MRVCVFLPDLAAILSRTQAVLADAHAITGGEPVTELCFVGVRQSRDVGGAAAYQPYVVRHYALHRLANAALRLAGTQLVPQATARAALKVCGPAVVEAVLACDPELVLLDARWGRHMAALLEPEFPGRVFLTGSRTRSDRLQPNSAAETVSADTVSADTVSIVLPTYNGTRFLRQSLASCLAQSHAAVDVIVVDDGSNEDIAAIVESSHDPRVRYIRHAINQGLPAALNTGFRHATGTLLTWTSDDNYYAPDAIRRMSGFLARHPSIAFVYTAMHVIGDTVAGASRVRLPLPPSELEHQNGVGACFLYRRAVYDAIGEYNPSAALVEDYDYWLRVSKRFRMQRMFAPLYHYRHHAASLTAQHGTAAISERFHAVRQQNGVA